MIRPTCSGAKNSVIENTVPIMPTKRSVSSWLPTSAALQLELQDDAPARRPARLDGEAGQRERKLATGPGWLGGGLALQEAPGRPAATGGPPKPHHHARGAH